MLKTFDVVDVCWWCWWWFDLSMRCRSYVTDLLMLLIFLVGKILFHVCKCFKWCKECVTTIVFNSKKLRRDKWKKKKKEEEAAAATNIFAVCKNARFAENEQWTIRNENFALRQTDTHKYINFQCVLKMLLALAENLY